MHINSFKVNYSYKSMINLEEIAFQIPKSMSEKETEQHKELLKKASNILRSKIEKEGLEIYKVGFGTEENNQTHLLLIPRKMVPEDMEFGRGSIDNPNYFSGELSKYIIENLIKKKYNITRYEE